MIVGRTRIYEKQQALSGTQKILVSIGGISCGIFSHDTDFLDSLRVRYKRFESSGPSSYEILVKLLPAEKIILEKSRHPPFPIIKRINSGNNYILKQGDTQFSAVANTFSQKVLVRTEKSAHCFDSFLLTLYMLILAGKKGLVVRASAARENGRCSVYFNPSGADKAPAVLAAKGVESISDEMVIIRPHNGGFRVFGTPFQERGASHGKNGRAELGGLFYTRKDDKNSMALLDKVQAIAHLYQCLPYCYIDRQLQDRTFEACKSLIGAVDVYELCFMPESYRQPVPA